MPIQVRWGHISFLPCSANRLAMSVIYTLICCSIGIHVGCWVTSFNVIRCMFRAGKWDSIWTLEATIEWLMNSHIQQRTSSLLSDRRIDKHPGHYRFSVWQGTRLNQRSYRRMVVPIWCPIHLQILRRIRSWWWYEPINLFEYEEKSPSIEANWTNLNALTFWFWVFTLSVLVIPEHYTSIQKSVQLSHKHWHQE